MSPLLISSELGNKSLIQPTIPRKSAIDTPSKPSKKRSCTQLESQESVDALREPLLEIPNTQETPPRAAKKSKKSRSEHIKKQSPNTGRAENALHQSNVTNTSRLPGRRNGTNVDGRSSRAKLPAYQGCGNQLIEDTHGRQSSPEHVARRARSKNSISRAIFAAVKLNEVMSSAVEFDSDESERIPESQPAQGVSSSPPLPESLPSTVEIVPQSSLPTEKPGALRPFTASRSVKSPISAATNGTQRAHRPEILAQDTSNGITFAAGKSETRRRARTSGDEETSSEKDPAHSNQPASQVPSRALSGSMTCDKVALHDEDKTESASSDSLDHAVSSKLNQRPGSDHSLDHHPDHALQEKSQSNGRARIKTEATLHDDVETSDVPRTKEASIKTSRAKLKGSIATKLAPRPSSAPNTTSHEASASRELITGAFSAEERAIVDKAFHMVQESFSMTDAELRQHLEVWRSEPARDLRNRLTMQLPQRSLPSIRRYCKRHYHNEARGPWTPEEETRLKKAYSVNKDKWSVIAVSVGRRAEDCRDRWRDISSRKDTVSGPWSIQEEHKLASIVEELVMSSGQTLADDATLHINWNIVCERMDSTRSAKQCRKRFKRLQNRLASGTISEKRKLDIADPMSEKGAWGVAAKAIATFGPGDMYDALLEIAKCITDRGLEYADPMTIWQICATKFQDSRFTTKIRRRVLEGFLICRPEMRELTVVQAAHSLAVELRNKYRGTKMERRYKVSEKVKKRPKSAAHIVDSDAEAEDHVPIDAQVMGDGASFSGALARAKAGVPPNTTNGLSRKTSGRKETDAVINDTLELEDDEAVEDSTEEQRSSDDSDAVEVEAGSANEASENNMDHTNQATGQDETSEEEVAEEHNIDVYDSASNHSTDEHSNAEKEDSLAGEIEDANAQLEQELVASQVNATELHRADSEADDSHFRPEDSDGESSDADKFHSVLENQDDDTGSKK